MSELYTPWGLIVRTIKGAVLRSIKTDKKIAAVILSHNCGDMLRVAIEKCRISLFDEIIITDDGSVDGSIQKIKSEDRLIVVQTNRRGYGANLKNGLQAALDRGVDYAVEVHGDGAQFDPSATYSAIKMLENGTDLIVGSRLINLQKSKDLGYPFIRMYGNICLCWAYKKLINVPNSEFHVGFHIYSKRLISSGIQQLSDSYIFPVEIVCWSKFHGFKIDEVPVLCDYQSDHTSHNLFGAFLVSMQAFYIILLYHFAKLGLSYGFLKNAKSKM